MTDPTDLPPSTTGSSDDADGRWFRDTVAPVVDTTPVPDAWDDIRARATGESPDVVRLAPGSGGGRPPVRRRLALAAAAVLAVAGIGGALAVTRDDGSDDETVTAVPSEESSGWYVPEELPEGWELESVSTDWLDVEGRDVNCPCQDVFWLSADGTGSLAVVQIDADSPAVSEESIANDQEDIEEITLSGDIPARLGTTGPYEVVTWFDGDSVWQVVSRNLDRSELQTAASRVATDPATAPVAGYREVIRASRALEGVRAYHSVLVQLRNPERGMTVAYELDPFGSEAISTLLAGAVEPLAGFPPGLPLQRVLVDGGAVATWYLGQWESTWITAGANGSGLASSSVQPDEIEAILRTLRPATGEEWRAFLDSATGTVDDDARTDRLSDLIVYEGEVVPGLDDEPSDTTDTSSGTTEGDSEPGGRDTPATLLITHAQATLGGRTPLPDNLFAPSVAIGLDFETVRTVGSPNLVDPAAWVIGEDDVEYYAGYTPPFSALELLADADSTAIAAGGPEGCATINAPTPPPTTEGQRLLTITPDDIDSCIDWFAVTLVLDEQDRIAGVHLYLREP